MTSLLPEKRRPGQKAAQSAAAGVEGRSPWPPAPGRARARARGWPGRSGGWGGDGRPTPGPGKLWAEETTSLLSSSTLAVASSRLGPRRRAARVPPAGGAAEEPWAHRWGSGVELGPSCDPGFGRRASPEGAGRGGAGSGVGFSGQREEGGAARTSTASRIPCSHPSGGRVRSPDLLR